MQPICELLLPAAAFSQGTLPTISLKHKAFSSTTMTIGRTQCLNAEVSFAGAFGGSLWLNDCSNSL